MKFLGKEAISKTFTGKTFDDAHDKLLAYTQNKNVLDAQISREVGQVTIYAMIEVEQQNEEVGRGKLYLVEG